MNVRFVAADLLIAAMREIQRIIRFPFGSPGKKFKGNVLFQPLNPGGIYDGKIRKPVDPKRKVKKYICQ